MEFHYQRQGTCSSLFTERTKLLVCWKAHSMITLMREKLEMTSPLPALKRKIYWSKCFCIRHIDQCHATLFLWKEKVIITTLLRFWILLLLLLLVVCIVYDPKRLTALCYLPGHPSIFIFGVLLLKFLNYWTDHSVLYPFYSYFCDRFDWTSDVGHLLSRDSIWRER